jgi:hypothetical protein
MAGAIFSCARALALIATIPPATASPALRTRRRVVSSPYWFVIVDRS